MTALKRTFSKRVSEFYQWRIRARLTRAYRILGPRFQSVTVRGLSIRLLISSDIEQYRLDSYSAKEPETLGSIYCKVRSGTVFYVIGATQRIGCICKSLINPVILYALSG